jgi:hypothetical protein
MLRPEHREFLATRMKQALKEQPELRQLSRILLRIGGAALVPPPWPDPDVCELIQSGFVSAGPIRLRAGRPNCCHENLAAMWGKPRSLLVALGTGYALSPDGLWRQHSWGVLREGIIETTVVRTKYFGILLQGERADQFAQWIFRHTCSPTNY